MADEAALPAALEDPDRLRSLARLCVGAASDEAFDRFAGLVKRLLGIPVAPVSLVDAERQYFPGQVGHAEPWSSKRETPLTHSFCRHVVAEGQPKTYPDARIHAQVRDNLAIPELGVVAYADAYHRLVSGSPPDAPAPDGRRPARRAVVLPAARVRQPAPRRHRPAAHPRRQVIRRPPGPRAVAPRPADRRASTGCQPGRGTRPPAGTPRSAS